ncbi:glycosyl transferase family 2 [Polaribacter reichenbachii]|uniref:Glycosyl transferase family 2 n=1 Tax=Polaribacter reichenbachii TaxID=996801 RepID=A0A1B8TQ39_9FLAO|nr:glycosyltransferase [Polaribacter reichenbachii]APZ46757.1 glycosyl transferase family 2 [Polaribacter reichenbachii]AUC17400.1 glycosyl transferase family 2 [Polaribacter reichenbachii]OBY61725.1 glycosyl transferase family 2 [Polaribacter reichenbachii]
MKLNFSLIIPVYNRPKEIDELLSSLSKQTFSEAFEVLIIEDGSSEKSVLIVEKYQSQLNLKYFFKENTGAGASRNFGMQIASGNYFIVLDSDVIVPEQYLSEVSKTLEANYTDAFGGPDAAHKNFTVLQKAINYSMTSVLTTGGIRGKKKAVGKFQLRSFNFGISKTAFHKTQGFSKMKNGEDIDLTFRLWENNFETQLIDTAFVYHKRRSTIKQFYKQTFGFGTARPILNRKYPNTGKITYWFPSVFIVGLTISILLAIWGYLTLFSCYYLYFLALFFDSFIKNGLRVGFLSIITSLTQFLGYGLGFLKSQFFRKK